MKGNNFLFSVLQDIGRSFMLPIAILPVAGLMLGIGSSFTNQSTIEAFGLTSLLGNGSFLGYVFTIMSMIGSTIFANLPLIFSLGITSGMAKSEKSAAVISSLISFLTMNEAIYCMLLLRNKLLPGGMPEGSIINSCGIITLNMGVFGGILVGLVTSYLHNKFYKIKLPNFFSFFGGIRFIPIISSLVHAVIGIIMYFLWPPVQNIMFICGDVVLKSSYFGTFIYGLIERALIPFGLHHVFYMPFWQTALGGTMVVDGVSISGAQNIFFAQLASPSTTRFNIEASRFFTGKFPFMIFGLPGASLAMLKTSKPKNKHIVSGLLFSAALTSMIAGITEPIEFTFLFIAPFLYVLHCCLAGISFMLMHLFGVSVGMTFSGGFIDLLLFGIIQGNRKTNWLMMLPVGIVYFFVYYFLFKFLIERFNILTPGREADDQEVKLYTKKDYEDIEKQKNLTESKNGNKRVDKILEGLGGKANVSSIGSCATRLRIQVKDVSLVNKDILIKSGASGVILKGVGVQIVYGPEVTLIKTEIEEFIGSLDNYHE